MKEGQTSSGVTALHSAHRLPDGKEDLDSKHLRYSFEIGEVHFPFVHKLTGPDT